MDKLPCLQRETTFVLSLLLGLQILGLLLKERICSCRSKFLFKSLTPIAKVNNNENGRVASPNTIIFSIIITDT